MAKTRGAKTRRRGGNVKHWSDNLGRGGAADESRVPGELPGGHHGVAAPGNSTACRGCTRGRRRPLRGLGGALRRQRWGREAGDNTIVHDNVIMDY